MSTTTAELVDHVLTAMRDAASTGDTGALDKLKEQSSKEGKAPGTPAPGAASVSAETILETTEKKILRPNGENYYIRKLGPHDDVVVLRNARKKLINALLYGPPGTGKTALIEAAYAEGAEAAHVFTVQGSGDTEVADFVGGYVQLPGNVFEWVDGPLIKAMETGGVLYIDEIALIDPKVMAIVYGVMDGRDEIRITQNPDRGIVKATEGFYVVGACNPNAPGARMSEALLSRFDLQFEVTTDYSLAKKLGVNSKAVTAAQNMARKFEKGEMMWAPQLRELLSFKKIEELLGPQTALQNMVSTAPEMDRPTVADVLSRAFATSITELKLV